MFSTTCVNSHRKPFLDGYRHILLWHESIQLQGIFGRKSQTVNIFNFCFLLFKTRCYRDNDVKYLHKVKAYDKTILKGTRKTRTKKKKYFTYK